MPQQVNELLEKIKVFIKNLNEKGIPTPIFRDMVSNKPSITYTMLIVSFILTVLSSFKFGTDNLGLNFNQCLELLGYVGVGYIGRKWQKGDTTVEGKDSEVNEESKET